MEAFPFTKSDWEKIRAPMFDVVDAGFADDDVLRASAFQKFVSVLDALRAKYGRHPVLLETEADFTDETPRAIALYRVAIDLALAHGLPAYAIRISLASRYLDEPTEPALALAELTACQAEVAHSGDEYDRQWWVEAYSEARRLLRSMRG